MAAGLSVPGVGGTSAVRRRRVSVLQVADDVRGRRDAAAALAPAQPQRRPSRRAGGRPRHVVGVDHATRALRAAAPEDAAAAGPPPRRTAATSVQREPGERCEPVGHYQTVTVSELCRDDQTVTPSATSSQR